LGVRPVQRCLESLWELKFQRLDFVEFQRLKLQRLKLQRLELFELQRRLALS
jgi:hypothetical protein